MIAIKNNIVRQTKYNKTAVILLGSNERFYGSVTNMMVNFFLNQTNGLNCDRLIVGKSTHSALAGTSYSFPYKKIVFKRDLPEREEIQNLTAQVKDYAKVIVYYPQMKSVLIQTPVSKDITHLAG